MIPHLAADALAASAADIAGKVANAEHNFCAFLVSEMEAIIQRRSSTCNKHTRPLPGRPHVFAKLNGSKSVRQGGNPNRVIFATFTPLTTSHVPKVRVQGYNRMEDEALRFEHVKLKCMVRI